MAKVTGGRGHTDRLRRISGPEMVGDVGKALFAAGNIIQVEAQISISEGSVSGKAHVPSRPGQPPNNDTGVLANSIETVQVEPLKVEVSSNAPYAAPLEYGTSKMAARPYMRPAVAKTRKEVTALVRDSVATIVRRAR